MMLHHPFSDDSDDDPYRLADSTTDVLPEQLRPTAEDWMEGQNCIVRQHVPDQVCATTQNNPAMAHKGYAMHPDTHRDSQRSQDSQRQKHQFYQQQVDELQYSAHNQQHKQRPLPQIAQILANPHSSARDTNLTAYEHTAFDPACYSQPRSSPVAVAKEHYNPHQQQPQRQPQQQQQHLPNEQHVASDRSSYRSAESSCHASQAKLPQQHHRLHGHAITASDDQPSSRASSRANSFASTATYSSGNFSAPPQPQGPPKKPPRRSLITYNPANGVSQQPNSPHAPRSSSPLKPRAATTAPREYVPSSLPQQQTSHASAPYSNQHHLHAISAPHQPQPSNHPMHQRDDENVGSTTNSYRKDGTCSTLTALAEESGTPADDAVSPEVPAPKYGQSIFPPTPSTAFGKMRLPPGTLSPAHATTPLHAHSHERERERERQMQQVPRATGYANADRFVPSPQQEAQAEYHGPVQLQDIGLTSSVRQRQEQFREVQVDADAKWVKLVHVMNTKLLNVGKNITVETRVLDGCLNMLRVTKKNSSGQELLKNKAVTEGHINDLRSELSGYNADVFGTIQRCIRARISEPITRSPSTKSTTIVREPPFICIPATVSPRPVPWRELISKAVASHYMEDPSCLRQELAELENVQAHTCLPSPHSLCLEKMKTYYYYLIQLEPRFLKDNPLFTTTHVWVDPFTGYEVVSNHIATERQAILFNIGSAYSQIAGSFATETARGIEAAMAYFEMAAGAFKKILVNNLCCRAVPGVVPPMMCSEPMNRLLLDLMLAQAQECAWKLHKIKGRETHGSDFIPEYNEAWAVWQRYYAVVKRIKQAERASRARMPSLWVTIVCAKCDYYRAITDVYYGMAMAKEDCTTLSRRAYRHAVSTLKKLKKAIGAANSGGEATLAGLLELITAHLVLLQVYETEDDGSLMSSSSIADDSRSSVVSTTYTSSEASSLPASDSHSGRKKDWFFNPMRHLGKAPVIDKVTLEQEKGRDSGEESALSTHIASSCAGVSLAPVCEPKTWCSSNAVVYKLTIYDLFEKLGPVDFFFAAANLVKKQPFTMRRDRSGRLGLKLIAAQPPCVEYIEPGSPAARSGLLAPCFIVSVNHTDVRWMDSESAQKVLDEAGETVSVMAVFRDFRQRGRANSSAYLDMVRSLPAA